jgi:membrane protein implicated in regulation of membrane protease activity
VFSRVLGTCPNCGALRDHRRKHKKSQRLRDRVDRAWYDIKQRARRYKWYILYIGGGAFIAAVIHPTAMFLAEFSRPPDWRDTRWEAGWSLAHFFEPFVAAGETLLRWITGAVVGTASWIGDGVAWLLMAKPSLVFAAVVGGGIGAVLAWRRTRRRRRHRQKHRRYRSAGNIGLPADARQAGAAPTSSMDDDWASEDLPAPSARPLPRPGMVATQAARPSLPSADAKHMHPGAAKESGPEPSTQVADEHAGNAGGASSRSPVAGRPSHRPAAPAVDDDATA